MAIKKFDVEIKVDGDGNCDADATLSAFRPQLAQYQALTACDVEQVNEVLNSLFATPGIVMNVPATLNLAMSKLWNQDPSTFSILSARVHDVLSASETLIITKGKGGGVRKATESEAQYRREHGEYPKPTKSA